MKSSSIGPIMLLNASHPLFEGDLPSHLLDTYVRYKQGTRAIVAWLLRHGSGDSPCQKRLSINDMTRLATIIKAKASPVSMPENIDFHFRETIAARKYLSRFFRKSSDPEFQDADTSNHEHFTTSLTQLYADLCECCGKPKVKCSTATSHSEEQTSPKFPINKFTTLDVEDITETEEEHSEVAGGSSELRKPTNDHSAKVTAENNEPLIIDDDLGDTLELESLLRDVQGLFNIVNTSWRQAGQGEIPTVIAALTTNVVFAHLEKIEPQLLDLCKDGDLEVLRSRGRTEAEAPYPAMQGDGQGIVSVKSQPTVYEALQSPQHLLCTSKQNRKVVSKTPTSFIFQKPSEFILQDSAMSSQSDVEALTILLQNIACLTQSSRWSNSIVRSGSPLSTEIYQFYANEKKPSTLLRCAFGLRLLQESYKSYMWATIPAKASANCRIAVLKHTEEVIRNISTTLSHPTFPCRCLQTLAFHLEDLHSHLSLYYREKIFDLYFQAPWVCGAQMLEILDATFYYGLRLFSYRNYVGSVLHVYNILTTLTNFEPIPLFEELCEKFRGVVFPRERPNRNFRACFSIFMGGRLRFMKGHKSNNHRNSWHIAIPPHTAKFVAGMGLRKEANDSRFEYCKLSLFHHIKERRYQLDDTVWSRLEQPQSPTRSNPRKPSRQQWCPGDRQDIYNTPLLHLQQAIITEFEGDLPIAKINFFAVYMACVRIIEMISEKGHDDKENNQHCLCFANAMLEAADRYRANEHKFEPFGCPDLLKTCQNAMSEVLRNRPLSDFLWNF